MLNKALTAKFVTLHSSEKVTSNIILFCNILLFMLERVICNCN